MIFNPAIIGAIVVQSFISKASKITGAIAGFVITTGIMLWGISLYSDGFQIAFFGIPVSQSFFITACLVWYGFDIRAFNAAKKGTGQGAANQELMPPDSWTCNCGKVNYPSAQACQNCLKERITAN